LEPGRRIEAAGPLFYHEIKPSEETWALPPIFSRSHDSAIDAEEIDIVYPILTYERFGRQFRWQLFQLLSFAGGPTQTEDQRKRFSIFPVYFQQRSTDPDENYTALFPLYGHLKHRLFRDEIFFVLFPLYGQSRKRDVVTDNYLYPFFHIRHGDKLAGWQFWPLYGVEHKAITLRTNSFNDLELILGHDSRFVLWPFYFNDIANIGTGNPVRQWGSIPAFTIERSPTRESTTIGWPFFRHIDDREKGYREWQLPWPIIEFAHGTKTTTRIFPLYSKSHDSSLESDFLLWPLYKFDALRAEELERKRRRILFFLCSDVVERNTDTHATRRRTDVLPLFNYRRDWKGNTRLQIFSPIEIFLLGSHKVERDYSPLWSVWRSEHNAQTGANSQSFFWNLYRRDTEPNRKKISVLFGLYQSESEPGGKRVRLFHVALGKQKTKNELAQPPHAGNNDGQSNRNLK